MNGKGPLFQAKADPIVLVLNDELINKRIVVLGPFVMTSEEEIHQSMQDLKNGTFCGISPAR
ncbi:pirin-like C-terminal cupin domain-containing protein [Herbaspirillum sp. GCM10030257]|uniref:pirin-like C-terminal cupin domain-containing protein n=1 Tax=Herbaspirillum sp. GCM10030257 TaxID=3273393 RepID=UPI00362280E7